MSSGIINNRTDQATGLRVQEVLPSTQGVAQNEEPKTSVGEQVARYGNTLVMRDSKSRVVAA